MWTWTNKTQSWNVQFRLKLNVLPCNFSESSISGNNCSSAVDIYILYYFLSMFLWSRKLPKSSHFLFSLNREKHFTLGFKCEIKKWHLTIFNFLEITLSVARVCVSFSWCFVTLNISLHLKTSTLVSLSLTSMTSDSNPFIHDQSNLVFLNHHFLPFTDVVQRGTRTVPEPKSSHQGGQAVGGFCLTETCLFNMWIY